MLQSLLQTAEHSPGREKIHIRRKWDKMERKWVLSCKVGPCRLLCKYKAVDKKHGNFYLSSFLESFICLLKWILALHSCEILVAELPFNSF